MQHDRHRKIHSRQRSRKQSRSTIPRGRERRRGRAPRRRLHAPAPCRRHKPFRPYIRAPVAEYAIGLPSTDSVLLEESYRALADRYAADPTDRHNAYVYASVAQNLGAYRRLNRNLGDARQPYAPRAPTRQSILPRRSQRATPVPPRHRRFRPRHFNIQPPRTGCRSLAAAHITQDRRLYDA